MAKYIDDRGHGGIDGGTSYGKYREKDWTLDIGKAAENYLKNYVIDVQTTRDGDTTLNSTTRGNKVKNSGAEFCVSHHINAGGGLGAEIWKSIFNKDDTLAREILKNLKDIGLDVDRGIKTRNNNSGTDYYFMHRTTGNVTTYIVEYGFMDNKKDREFLSKASNRKKCGEATAKAIVKVYGLKKKSSSKPSTPKPSKPSTSGYQGNSIVEYLKSVNIDSSYSNRAKLAKLHGISNYRGTANQNISLLNKLRAGGSTSVSKPSQKKGDMKTNSIVDYLKSIKVDSSFGNRKKLAVKHGIKNYKGTANQNSKLLKKLRG